MSDGIRPTRPDPPARPKKASRGKREDEDEDFREELEEAEQDEDPQRHNENSGEQSLSNEDAKGGEDGCENGQSSADDGLGQNLDVRT